MMMMPMIIEEPVQHALYGKSKWESGSGGERERKKKREREREKVSK
jgi:hypothetical protein